MSKQAMHQLLQSLERLGYLSRRDIKEDSGHGSCTSLRADVPLGPRPMRFWPRSKLNGEPP
jgi:hypothetical protein